MTNATKTIEKILNALGWNQKKLCEELGEVQQTISAYVKGTRNPTERFCKKFLERTGIDFYASVEAGKIVIQDPTVLPFEQVRALFAHGACFPGIPVYDTWAIADIIQPEAFIRPMLYLPPPLYNGSTFGFRVKDNGMADKLYTGDFAICREVAPGDILSQGHIYYMALQDGHECMGYLFLSKDNPELLMLVPANPNWPNRLAYRKDVYKRYKITGVLREDAVLNQLAIAF